MRGGQFVVAVAAIGAVLAGSGCTLLVEDPDGATLEERARSLEGLEATAVAGEPLAHFAARRTLVVGGIEQLAGWHQYRAHGGFGSAAAVTTDGYVLTAAHCLVGRPVPTSVVNMCVAAPAPHRQARVVWNGWKAGAEGPDLALLHVDGRALRLGAAFELTSLDVAAVATRVFAAGYAQTATPRLAAGEVLSARCLAPARPGEPAVLELWTTAPLREGDSGGPTFDPAGRLLGIHSMGRWGPLDGWSILTHLPDPAWLRARIEADRRAQAAR